MRQAVREISVQTHGPGLYEITSQLADWIDTHRAEEGLLTIFIRHTSASLTVQENADPDVLRDLDDHFRRLAPEDPSLYRHTAEGPDDMPAHIRSALTLTQLSIPILDGRLALGTWQGIFVFEHRSGRFTRRLALHLLDQGRRK
jgi:secondary thiamine-phosphate synthase enzyme